MVTTHQPRLMSHRFNSRKGGGRANGTSPSVREQSAELDRHELVKSVAFGSALRRQNKKPEDNTSDNSYHYNPYSHELGIYT